HLMNEVWQKLDCKYGSYEIFNSTFRCETLDLNVLKDQNILDELGKKCFQEILTEAYAYKNDERIIREYIPAIKNYLNRVCIEQNREDFFRKLINKYKEFGNIKAHELDFQEPSYADLHRQFVLLLEK
ncbi:MAG TPA: hypothetical protein V6C63_03160, partial [Allocoleopsis sp.]